MTILTSRRSLITGLVALVAAPAIVRATSLMPVRLVKLGPVVTRQDILDALNFHMRRLVPVVVCDASNNSEESIARGYLFASLSARFETDEEYRTRIETTHWEMKL